MKKEIGKIAITASILAFLDQITKHFAIKNLETPNRIIKGFFELEYTENTGMAFGLPMPYYILLFGGIILLGVILYLASKEFNLKIFTAWFSVALIAGGAIGNIIDRIVNGFVVDFIAIWKWPNFNLADLFITTGILLLIIFYAKIKNDERKN